MAFDLPAHRSGAARVAALAAGLALACLLLSPASAVAAPGLGPRHEPPANAIERLDDALARGAIDEVTVARQKLYYLFDRARMDPRWRASQDPPPRCATPVLAAIADHLGRLDSATRALYARFTHTAGEEIAAPSGVYQTQHFRIEYQSSGPDAPPPDDVAPANGVPDFVERTGEACEHSWAVEVDALGYRAPEVPNGAQGRYLIQYQNQTSYGFTVVVSGQRTQIVLHPNYTGFPANDDPDGDALGALRVTVAHELKHAIQRMYTDWTEGSYLELDATWVEDIVYDDVNDYYNFIEVGASPFTAPYASLVSVGAASYEDCNWEHYQAERYGNVLMRTFWERRALIGEPPMSTYAANLLAYGTSLEEAFAEYVTWNFASGRHAAPGFGYQEAAAYPTTPATFTFTTLPVAATAGSVPGMAANTALIENPDGALAGIPEFSFTGSENPSLTFGISVLLCDRQGAVTRVAMPLAGGSGTLTLASLDWADLKWAALVMGNTIDFPLYVPYSFSVRAIAPILITHQRLGDLVRSEDPAPVRAVVRPGTAAVDPASVTLDYRVGGGAIVTTPMSPTGVPDDFGAAIPPQPFGATIAYRISARSIVGDPVTSPAAPGSWYLIEVANAFESFETAAGGWTVGDAGDGATAGAWERAQPSGTIAAPYFDATLPPGTQCYLTAAGDVDGGRTTLLSPVYTLVGGGYVRSVARYRRWYSNQIGGRFDDTWRVDASNDGGATWANVETVTQGENDWKTIEIDLLALFGQPSLVRFRFVAEDIGDPSLVEAGVDDFELIAVQGGPVAVVPPAAGAPRIGLAAPNPSRAGVGVPLWLSAPAVVSATVRDAQGRTVRSLARGDHLGAGLTRVSWDGRAQDGDLAPTGYYWIEIVVDRRRAMRRAVILR